MAPPFQPERIVMVLPSIVQLSQGTKLSMATSSLAFALMAITAIAIKVKIFFIRFGFKMFNTNS
jgi:hypothetical protein